MYKFNNTLGILLIFLATLKLNADSFLYGNLKSIFLINKSNTSQALKEKPFPIYYYSKYNKKLDRTIIVSHFTIDNNNFITEVIINHR